MYFISIALGYVLRWSPCPSKLNDGHICPRGKDHCLITVICVGHSYGPLYSCVESNPSPDTIVRNRSAYAVICEILIALYCRELYV